MGKTRSFGSAWLARITITALLVCAAQWSFAASNSDTTLEEVIVTAQKRTQSLQDVTLSVTALTQDFISKRGLEGYRDWADYVPGVTMFEGIDANRRTGPSATIRGVTNTGRGQLYEGTASLTTSYAIGQVPFFDANPFTYDLNRIEVLRGPQGTLFGISSMGGVIRFIPNEAQTDQFSAEIGGGGGLISHGSTQWESHVMMNVPIIENVLAVRVAAQYRKNNGYIDVYEPGLDQTGQDLKPVTNASYDSRNAPTVNTLTDANKSTTTGARFNITFTPNSRFTFKSSTTWQKSDTDQVPWADFNDVRPWVLTQFTLTPQGTKYLFSTIETSYKFDIGTLNFIGGYYDQDFYENFPITEQERNFLTSPGVDSIDLDGPGGLPPDPYPTRANFPFATHSSIWTAEVRLQGDNKPLGIRGLFGDELTLNYVIGGFYQNESRKGHWEIASPNWNANRGPNTAPILTQGGLILGAEGGTDYHSEAVFFDVTLNLSSKLAIGGGLRYFEQTRSIGQCNFGDLQSGKFTGGATVGDDLSQCLHPGTFQTVKEDGLTPSATASYHIDEDKMVYFTASEGKRMGQGNAIPDWPKNTNLPPEYLNECTATAQSLGVLDAIHNGTISDSVWSYELGLKSYWMDRKLLANISAYQEDWTDYQQTVLMVQYNPNCNTIVAANVGGAQIRGFELESTLLATDHITFNTAISYTHAEFVDIPKGVGSSLAGVNLQNGDSLRSVAPWTAVVGAEYHRDLPSFFGQSIRGYIRADWRYVDERMNNFGNEKLLKADPVRSLYFMKAYDLLDLRIGVTSGEWSGQFYVSNLLDKEVMFESTRNLRQTAIRVGGTNQPRTIGLNLSRRF